MDTPHHSIPDDILEELDTLKDNIINIPIGNKPCKKSREQVKILQNLYKDKDIIIKPADKGSSIVILNTKDYIFEANRQLSNQLHYKQIPEPISPKVTQQIIDILQKLTDQKILNKQQFQYLKPPETPKIRQFYLLPKIHKERNKWTKPTVPPGRPIVSDCASDTYGIAEFIDCYLKPIANKHPLYVKDTPDFLHKIRSTKIP